MASLGVRHYVARLPQRLQRCYSTSAAEVITVDRLLRASSPKEGNVTVNGYIRSIRNQKTRSFAAVGDGTTLQPIQALLTPAQAQDLTTGSAVSLTGSWKPSPKSDIQRHELHVEDVTLVGAADPATYPLQKKYHTPEYLRTIPHIRTRTPFNALMLRFRSMSIAQLTKFFAAQEFVQTHPPVITSSDCEGAGEVFGVVAGAEKSASPSSSGNVAGQHDDELFFRSPKYLTVSTQLHLEALAQAVGKVWTLSPTFRAEKSETNRHLSEFYMLEAEVAFVERLDGVMDVTENMLRDLTQALYDTSTVQEIIRGRRTGESKADAQQTYISQELEQRWKGMMSADWPRITYTEAVALLQESGQKFVHQPIWGNGLQAEHERFIASSVGKGKPVFVTHYPKSIKPFYMLPTAGQNPSGPTVDCFDLLVPEVCEITGGSMREHRLAELLNSMQQQGLISPAAAEKYGKDVDSDDLGSLQWYVDLRRWGSVPHGGFGLGFDRLIGYLSGVQNIRDVVAFPRWVGRCDC